jgi:MOSC domain-containing protein YiiM
LARNFYQIASYRHWQDQFGRSDFTFGQFGENFIVEGLSDDEVCIGVDTGSGPVCSK